MRGGPGNLAAGPGSRRAAPLVPCDASAIGDRTGDGIAVESSQGVAAGALEVTADRVGRCRVHRPPIRADHHRLHVPEAGCAGTRPGARDLLAAAYGVQDARHAVAIVEAAGGRIAAEATHRRAGIA